MEVKWAGPQGHALETRIRSFRPVRNDSSATKTSEVSSELIHFPHFNYSTLKKEHQDYKREHFDTLENIFQISFYIRL